MKTVATLLTLPVALALALPALAKDFEQSVPAESGGRLRVDLSAGSVVIESHELEEVRVGALAAGMGSRSLDVELSSDGDEVRLRGDIGGWLASMLGGPRVRVLVRVPTEFSVDVRTAGGEVTVEELEGEVRARTSGGRIEVGNVEGDVDIETSGGPIEAERIQGDLRARTSGGSITIRDVTGEVNARTSGGPIEVLGADQRVDAETSGGSVRVRFREGASGRLKTSGGHIEVELPESDGVDLDARTSGGRVDIDAAIEVNGRVERGRVQAELNGGGDELRLDTSGGNIEIRLR